MRSVASVKASFVLGKDGEKGGADLCRRGRRAWLASTTALLLLSAGVPSAYAQDMARGAAYQPVPPAANDQAQLVILRKPDGGAPVRGNAAHVYVDGSFNTALLPDSYTRLCVAPGWHTVEAYVGDAPTYAGKASPKTRVELVGGRTYFVAVADPANGELKPMRRDEMEPALAGVRTTQHVLNRARAVQPCRAATETYAFSSDVLFAFGRGDYASISRDGQKEIDRVARTIADQAEVGRIQVKVRGHADPIGSDDDNLRLSQQRAQSVQRALVHGGLPGGIITAQGLGSSQLVVNCSSGPATPERVDCNAPNRRVEVEVGPAVP